MLDVAAVTKAYGHLPALADVSFRIAEGEILSLLGPNGAGKTTLISIVSGLRLPDAGTVRVKGVDVVAEPRRAKRSIGVAPQELGIYPTLTVAQNLRFFAELSGLGGPAAIREAERVAGLLDISHLLGQRSSRLSGGEKRRLHTAAALVGSPPLLLLDEPTAGVDVATRAKLLDAVRQLAQEGSAVCYTTHYLQEPEVLGSNVAILERGKVIAHGALSDLMATHGEASVEITFERSAPRTTLVKHPELVVERSRRSVLIRGRQPERAIADVLGRANGSHGAVCSIDLVRPSLESVFIGLTGRRAPNASLTDDPLRS